MTGYLHLLSSNVMRRAPFMPVAVGLILGVISDSLFMPAPAWCLGLFAISVVLGLVRSFRKSMGPVLLCLAAGSLGGMAHLGSGRLVPASSIGRLTGGEGRIARVTGLVVSPPRVMAGSPYPFARWTSRTDRTVFLLEVRSLAVGQGEVAVSQRIRVSVGEVVLDLRENEWVEVFGWLYPLRPPRNPGQFDWSAFQRRQGVVAGLACKQRENVRRISTDPPATNLVAWFRNRVRGLLTDDLATGSLEEAGLLAAMVLGHRSQLDRRLNDIFVRAGCIHFLAVSGVHVVIVMLLVRVVCRLMMLKLRTTTWIMLAAVIGYVVLAEPRPPILRAGTLSVLYCVACLLGRRRSSLNWISIAAILLVFLQPTTVFDVGFQLSFVACLGVVFLRPALVGLVAWVGHRARWAVYGDVIAAEEVDVLGAKAGNVTFGAREGGGWRRALMRAIGAALMVSVAAWLATLPIVAWHFQRAHPWGVLNSVLVAPLVMVIMALGFAKLAGALLAPGIGIAVGVVLGAVNAWFLWMVEWLSRLPGASLSASAPPWWLVVAYYAFLLVLVWRFPVKRPTSLHAAGSREDDVPIVRVGQWAMVAASVVLLVAVVAWCLPGARKGQLVVTFLSVGLGSATVIELPDGSALIYDAGSNAPYDVGRTVVVPFLKHRGIRRLDAIHISHPNLDHFSGVPSVVEAVDAGPILVTPYFESLSGATSPSRHLLDLMQARGRRLEVLDFRARRWVAAGVEFEILWPPENLSADVSANNTSMVLRLTYAGRSILLTGDIEDRAQRGLLALGNLEADVLVLPHHGSIRRSSGDFFAAVNAKVLVRSSSEGMDETFSELPRMIGDTPLFNTADVGAVRISIDDEGVSVTGTWASAQPPFFYSGQDGPR